MRKNAKPQCVKQTHSGANLGLCKSWRLKYQSEKIENIKKIPIFFLRKLFVGCNGVEFFLIFFADFVKKKAPEKFRERVTHGHLGTAQKITANGYDSRILGLRLRFNPQFAETSVGAGPLAELLQSPLRSRTPAESVPGCHVSKTRVRAFFKERHDFGIKR